VTTGADRNNRLPPLLVNEWAAKESSRSRSTTLRATQENDITIATEAQAKSGHDILADGDMVGHTPRPELLEPIE